MDRPRSLCYISSPKYPAHTDGQLFTTWMLLLVSERVKESLETQASIPNRASLTVRENKRLHGTVLPVMFPSSPVAGEESAFGHLGRLPTSWSGGPHFAPSAHYILQQTLDGVHPLVKTWKKPWRDMGWEESHESIRYKLGAFTHTLHGFQKA